MITGITLKKKGGKTHTHTLGEITRDSFRDAKQQISWGKIDVNMC